MPVKETDNPPPKAEQPAEAAPSAASAAETASTLLRNQFFLEAKSLGSKPSATGSSGTGDAGQPGNEIEKAHAKSGGDFGPQEASGDTGEKVEYKDKLVKGSSYVREYSKPPGYKANVIKGEDGKEQINSVWNKDGKFIAKVGEGDVKKIQGVDAKGRVTVELENGKYEVRGSDGSVISKYSERKEGGKTIRTYDQPPGVEATYENGKLTEVSYTSGEHKQTWKIGADGKATRVDGKRGTTQIDDAKFDPVTGELKGKGHSLDSTGKRKETFDVTVKPGGSLVETHDAKDKSGKAYKYEVSRDEDGHVYQISRPVIKDGKVVEGTTQTTSFDYERDEKGRFKMKDGKPVLKGIDFKITDAKGNSEELSMTKEPDGSWKLQEKKDGKLTPVKVNGKEVKWNANPTVDNDGTLTKRDPDGNISKIAADGTTTRTNLGKGPQTEAEKKASKDRSEIRQVGTNSKGEPMWGLGVPNPLEQFGFDGYGAEKGNLKETWDSGKGYTYDIEQKVDKDGNITKRETKFNSEKGVQVYYRDADGNLKKINGVTSIVSERQPDGTYKTTYHVKGENPNDPNAPKPISVHTTLDGRYVDQNGHPVGGETDQPQQPKPKHHAGSQEGSASNIFGMAKMIKAADTNTPEGKKRADELTKDLLDEQIKLEEKRMEKAMKENDQKALMEAEKRKADFEAIRQDDAKRKEFIAKLKKGEIASAA